MKIFWPHRSEAKGFSIEKLARKYHEKISFLSSNKISNSLPEGTDLQSTNEDSKQKELINLSIKRGHWANRDFSEYMDVA